MKIDVLCISNQDVRICLSDGFQRRGDQLRKHHGKPGHIIQRNRCGGACTSFWTSNVTDSLDSIISLVLTGVRNLSEFLRRPGRALKGNLMTMTLLLVKIYLVNWNRS